MSSVSTNQKRIEEIDFLRGFAICMVVLGHAVIEFPVNISQVSWCSWLRYGIYSFHMPLFFAVSGFVYHCSSYGCYVRSKTCRILIPYILFGAASVLLHLAAPSLVNGVEAPKESVIRILIHGGDYWFLYTLYCIFLLFPPITAVLKERSLILLSAAIIALQCFVNLPEYLTLAQIAYYLPWFVAGYLCRLHLNRLKCFFRNHSAAIAPISLALSILIIHLCKHLELSNIVFKYMRAVFPILLLSALAHLLVQRPNTGLWGVLKGFLVKCSSYSLQFYLFNGYFLTISRFVLCKLLHITNPFIIISVITVFTIAGSLVLCGILRRIPIISFFCGFSSKKRYVSWRSS